MNDPAAEKFQEVLRPIASLISKSEKAREKLSPGTWQHAMITRNIRALRIGSALINKKIEEIETVTREDLSEALRALADMVNRTEHSQSKFLPETSQYTLQRNRRKALHMAKELITMELNGRNA